MLIFLALCVAGVVYAASRMLAAGGPESEPVAVLGHSQKCEFLRCGRPATDAHDVYHPTGGFVVVFVCDEHKPDQDLAS